MKKIFLLVLALCAVLLSVSCGAGDADGEGAPTVFRPELELPPPAAPPLGVPIAGFVPDERAAVTVDFWHAMRGAERAGIQAVITAFHEAQSYVRVNEVAWPNRARLEAELAIAELAGTLPHIATLTPSEITRFRYERVLLPLNTFMDDPHVGIGAEEIAGIFDELRAGVVFHDIWYGLPFAKSILVLYYRPEAVPAVPATWAELERVARASGLEIAADLDAVFASLLAQNGGVYIDYASGNAAFASPAGVAAMETLAALVTIANDSHNGTPPALRIAFSSDRPGEGRNSSPLPATQGNNAAEFAGESLVLFENVRHAIDERVGAWEFLRFTLQTETAVDWAIAANTLPQTYSAAFLPRYRAHLIANPDARGGEASLAGGFWRTRHGHADAVRSILLEEMALILAGDITADVGLTRAEIRASEALAALR